MKIQAALFFLASVGLLHAERIRFELEANKPKEVIFPWKCDDRDYRNPSGYFAPTEPTDRVVKKVSIRALGPDSLDLWALEVNGRETLDKGGLEKWFAGDGKNTLWSMYNRWREQRHHGSTGLDENYNAWGIINLWGVSWCGHDARCFAELARKAGIRSRLLPMNMHEVNEYRINGEWVVLDTDQNVFYPKLDGRAASFNDLRQDPFLVLRAKPFGRTGEWNSTAAWSNLAHFDFRRGQTFIWDKAGRLSRLDRKPYLLLSGESADYYYDSSRKGEGGALCRDYPQCGLIDFNYHPIVRKQRGVGMETPYPLGEGGPNRKPSFQIRRDEDDKNEQVITTYGARQSFPQFHAGANKVVLHTLNGKGRAEITVEFSMEASEKISPPAPVLKVLSVSNGIPQVEIGAPNAKQLWWQLSSDNSFEMVVPNFDKVEGVPMQKIVISNPLEQTFLLPKRPYYVRAKAQIKGLWSEWSQPVSFVVEKPDAPSGLACVPVSGDRDALIKWKNSSGVMLVYGSNRTDFIPELYSGSRASSGVLTECGALAVNWEPDPNFLAQASADQGSVIVPRKNFYRLIRKEGDVLSVPSPILRLETSDFTGLPCPSVFALGKVMGKVGDVVARPVDVK
jgi:hypothetical protein